MPTSGSMSGRQAKYLISDEHKFIYFIMPKCACSSVKTALLPLFDVDGSEQLFVQEDDAPEVDVHKVFGGSGYQINRNQFMRRVSGGEYQDYFKFAFVRNPWDRLVSCYSNKILDVEEAEIGKPPFLKLPSDKGSRLYKGMPFADFVETVHEIPDDEANAHFMSQHATICGPGEDHPVMADFVGRFENLTSDFAVVADRLGSSQKLQLPHRLRSISRQSRPYSEYYDDRLRDLVYERYRVDIETFGYSFSDSHALPPLWRQDGQSDARRLKHRLPDISPSKVWRRRRSG